MDYIFGRNVVDAAFRKTKAFPHAGETNYCDSLDSTLLPIDLEDAHVGRPVEFEMEWRIPATPSLADSQTITFTLQGSDDGLTFVDTDTGTVPAFTATVTGSGGLGGPARIIRFGLPILISRYLVVKMTTSAGDGDPSSGDSFLTVSLVF